MTGAAREVALVTASDAALGARLRAATWRGAIPTVVVAPGDRRAGRLAVAAGAEIASVWPDRSRQVVLVDRPLDARESAALAGRTVIAAPGALLATPPGARMVSIVGSAGTALPGAGVCREGTEVVVQHSTRTVLPSVPGLVEHRRARRFGDTALTFLRARGYTPDGSRP